MATKRVRGPDKTEQVHKAINEAINALEEHWVYDAAELFADCAIATRRIVRMLTQLKRKPDKIAGCERKTLTEIREFIWFIKHWEWVATKHFIAPLACPDDVEFHLKRIRDAGFSGRDKAKKRRDELSEDTLRSLERIAANRKPN
jgi:hypothetical protein